MLPAQTDPVRFPNHCFVISRVKNLGTIDFRIKLGSHRFPYQLISVSKTGEGVSLSACGFPQAQCCLNKPSWFGFRVKDSVSVSKQSISISQNGMGAFLSSCGFPHDPCCFGLLPRFGEPAFVERVDEPAGGEPRPLRSIREANQ